MEELIIIITIEEIQMFDVEILPEKDDEIQQ
jgi:hypothetical protein